jgi:hypothetical protein
LVRGECDSTRTKLVDEENLRWKTNTKLFSADSKLQPSVEKSEHRFFLCKRTEKTHRRIISEYRLGRNCEVSNGELIKVIVAEAQSLVPRAKSREPRAERQEPRA